MNNHECTMLRYATDAEFAGRAEGFGMRVWGPSPHGGSFLIEDTDKRAWLFGRYSRAYGRTCVPSVVTALNIAVMTGQPLPDGA